MIGYGSSWQALSNKTWFRLSFPVDLPIKIPNVFLCHAMCFSERKLIYNTKQLHDFQLETDGDTIMATAGPSGFRVAKLRWSFWSRGNMALWIRP